MDDRRVSVRVTVMFIEIVFDTHSSSIGLAEMDSGSSRIPDRHRTVPSLSTEKSCSFAFMAGCAISRPQTKSLELGECLGVDTWVSCRAQFRGILVEWEVCIIIVHTYCHDLVEIISDTGHWLIGSFP